MVRYGMAWYGMAWHGMAWCGMAPLRRGAESACRYTILCCTVLYLYYTVPYLVVGAQSLLVAVTARAAEGCTRRDAQWRPKPGLRPSALGGAAVGAARRALGTRRSKVG